MRYLIVLASLLILPAGTTAEVVTFPGAVAEGYSAVSEVKGDLELPGAKAGGKLPVVLVLHGSAGIDGRGEFHGKALNAAGIGTLEIFMFSRGNRPRAGRNENLTHMYGALKYLGSRPEIDPGRIGVMGFSWGGGLSLTAASASITQLFTGGQVRFAAHAPFYPVCWSHLRMTSDPNVTEELLVPDTSLSIRDGAIAAWPGAWQGANLRSIVSGLGHDLDRPWHRLRKKDRDWLLYTDEQPSVLIKPERDRIDHGYYGKFWSARKHVMHVLADSKSQQMRDRAMRFVRSVPCPACHGSGLRPEALAVTFAGKTIAEVNALPLAEVVALLRPVAELSEAGATTSTDASGETTEVAVRISADLVARIEVLLDLGLGYLSLGRSSTTLSPGEAQRLRIATQLRSGLFGVVYVLDEPSAGLHPADAEPLLDVLDRLKASGNSLFVVEHDLDVVRRADWVVDIGPGAGEGGGRVLYSGPVAGLEGVEESATSRYLFGRAQPVEHTPGRRTGGCTCTASPGTTCAMCQATCPSACSRP